MDKIVWTIAGSDSCAGAGIQSDLKTFHDFEVYGCSVVTAVTAQNTVKIGGIHYVSSDSIQSQLSTLNNDLPAKAIKIGMIGTVENVIQLGNFLNSFSGKVVLDPIIFAGSGQHLFHQSLDDYLMALKKLFFKIDLLTPNRQEAEFLLGKEINNPDSIVAAAQEFLLLGVKSVLIKGGHFNNDLYSQDYWTDGQESCWLSSIRTHGIRYHGTGCVLSAAVTACLALGYDIKDALVIGKMYVNKAIRLASRIGQGAAILSHPGWPEDHMDLPQITDSPILPELAAIEFGEVPLGLYPVVNRFEWVKKLIPLGVKTIQLRIKDLSGQELEREIQQSITLANEHQVRLFVNDYWELAIRYGAYGVHVGQASLSKTDFIAINQANLRLGISTHSYFELAKAMTYRPSYVALGAIYPTTSKLISFPPQGLNTLARWRRLVPCQLVAIGGISISRLPEVLSTGVDGVAMISAITNADDLKADTQRMLSIIEEYYDTQRRIASLC